MIKNRTEPEIPLGQLLLGAFRWFDRSLLATLEARGWPGLTQSQSNLMANLGEKGIRLSELARRIGVTRQAIHNTVKELEALGLVNPVVDPTNLSAKLVVLTPQGRENVKAALKAFQDIEASLESRLGPETVQALRHALERDWGDPIVIAD